MIKIIKDEPVRTYEFTYLLPASYISGEVEKVKTKIEALAKKLGGKIISTDDWGKKELAYTISQHKKSHKEAIYLHALVSLPAKQVAKFERGIILDEEIIRHLLVVVA